MTDNLVPQPTQNDLGSKAHTLCNSCLSEIYLDDEDAFVVGRHWYCNRNCYMWIDK